MSCEIVIIGAGGKVGSNLLGFLDGEPGLRVVGVCRNEVTAGPLRLAGHDVRCGDVTAPSEIAGLLGQADVVVNCAAASGPPGRARQQDEAVIGALAAGLGTRRLIHFSSVAVYGSCIDASRNTFDAPNPDDPYGRDKLHLERVLHRALGRRNRAHYVLRLGHVYGERQWVSRYVFDFVAAGLRLPLDGQLPSNAIHVHNVAAAIRRLTFDAVEPGTYNLIDQPGSTWREVFDWNTVAAGLDRVLAMEPAEADELLERHRGLAATPLPSRAASEVRTWLRSLPHALLTASPSLKAAGAIALATLKLERLEKLVSMKYSVEFAQAAKQKVKTPEIPKLGKLLSDAMPGPNLSYPAARDDEDARRVAVWHRRYSSPDAVVAEAAALPAIAAHGERAAASS
jgi:nucleoside-diphosphate-sugar epimerase